MQNPLELQMEVLVIKTPIKKEVFRPLFLWWASLVNARTFVREVQKINLELLRETFKILAV